MFKKNLSFILATLLPASFALASENTPSSEGSIKETNSKLTIVKLEDEEVPDDYFTTPRTSNPDYSTGYILKEQGVNFFKCHDKDFKNFVIGNVSDIFEFRNLTFRRNGQSSMTLMSNDRRKYIIELSNLAHELGFEIPTSNAGRRGDLKIFIPLIENKVDFDPYMLKSWYTYVIINGKPVNDSRTKFEGTLTYRSHPDSGIPDTIAQVTCEFELPEDVD